MVWRDASFEKSSRDAPGVFELLPHSLPRGGASSLRERWADLRPRCRRERAEVDGDDWEDVVEGRRSRVEVDGPAKAESELRAIAESEMPTASDCCSSKKDQRAKLEEVIDDHHLRLLCSIDEPPPLLPRPRSLPHGALLRPLLGLPPRPDPPIMQQRDEVRI